MIEVNVYDKALYDAIKKHCSDDFKDQLNKGFEFGGKIPDGVVGGVLADDYYGGTNRFLHKELSRECIERGKAVKVGGKWFPI